MQVQAPQIQWKQLKDFPLSKLKSEFQIADFERKQVNAQVQEILRAILANKFYDNVIRVVKVNEKFVVIDSQHRIQALYLAFTEHGVKTYDLMLAIYTKSDARTIYRRLNLGKRLLPKDHTKALDDGTIPIFNELKGYASHTKDNTTMPFYDILNAINYVKNKSRRPLTPGDYDGFVRTITPDEIEGMKTMLAAMRRFNRGTTGTFFYQVLMFRNIYRLTLEKKLNSDQIYDLVIKCNKSNDLLALSTERKMHLLYQAYEIMVGLL